ncbi:MAG: hypothetical protein HY400_06305, partial [Elusimicrobia bacterium]|nr:hypothetical protein [Elusimicrobiota bacterium]
NRSAFVDGCKANKISPKLANKIFDHMTTFGSYGFNKSHTVAYATVAYQTAYLKANYPTEVLAALLTSEIGRSAIDVEDKENKLVTYLEEAKSLGIPVLPPDVQKSQDLFSIERSPEGAAGPGIAPAAIRFGLLAIKNVGSGAVESILKTRKEEGLFAHLENLLARVDLRQVNKKVLESLIKAGALDSLSNDSATHQCRARMLEEIETLLLKQTRIKEEKRAGQGLLFEPSSADSPPSGANTSQPSSLSDHELLKFEREVLGFYLSGHPLQRYRGAMACVVSHTCATLSQHLAGTIRIAGMITGVKRLVTRAKGEPWARASLEDLTGTVTLLVFPKKYAEGLGKKLQMNQIVAVSGRLNDRGDDETREKELIAEDILPMEEALVQWSKSLTLSLPPSPLQEPCLKNLKILLGKHPGPCPVYLEIPTLDHGMAVIETQERVRPSHELLEEIEKTLGEKTWRIASTS